MFTISISFVVTSIIKILQTVGFVQKASDEISRQDVKLKHSKMQENHLIKIVTLLRRVSAKIIKLSVSLSLIKQGLNKLATRKADIFWLYHAKLTLVYLHSL